MYEQLLTGARELQAQTVAMRREIHQEPELGLDLPQTRATVLDGLSGLDVEINQSQATTGLVV